MTRLSEDQYFIDMALSSFKRGPCLRRAVGCVLVDSLGYMLSTGFNGNPHGQSHCIDVPCPGANKPSGTDLDKCEAIHAEINALMHCKDIGAVHKCYTTTSPCIHCVKALLATQCTEIIFLQEYPHTESKDLWLKSNRKWTHHVN